MRANFQVEHVFAAGFALLVPVFLVGVVATWYESGLMLMFVFACFGVAGVVWVWRELPALIARLAETMGLSGPPVG